MHQGFPEKRKFPFRAILFALTAMALQLQPNTASANQDHFASELRPLDEFQVSQIVVRADHVFAYLIDHDSAIYHVEVGEFVGQNDGRIKKIDHCGVWIVERVVDDTDQWIERRNFLKTKAFDRDSRCSNAAKKWLGKH